MSAAAASSLPSWNLSALFSGIEDPSIEATWAKVTAQAKEFEEKYRGKLTSPDLDAATLLAAIQAYEAISQEASKPPTYASLIFAADTSNPAHGAFMSKQMERSTELSVALMFFELELQAASEDVISRLAADPSLAGYHHFIGRCRAFSPHRLSEDQEVILEEVANTGSRAWERLFEEVLSNHEFPYTDPATGEKKTLSEQEAMALLRDPNRAVRQAGADCLEAGLKQLERVLVFTFNNLLQDKAVDDRLRSFEFPEQARHLSNELDPDVVALVIRLCRENYPLVSRFYKVKQEILGLPELTHIDRYAPLNADNRKVPFDEAKSIVLDAFGKFSPEIQARADEFFAKGWIDAAPRKGKRGGAFCAYITPDTHPVVFQTYLDKTDDVMTLAHELGHGVHSSLSRAQTLMNFHGTLPMAELASTFGEMLVFESLVANATDEEKLSLYAEKIEGVFATIFRQAAMYQFEQRIHRARREEGELTPEQFGDIWQEELQAMFGESVHLGDQHRMWWSYIPHFIGSPFYVYAYSFGELVVLALYAMAKEEGPTFAPKYVEMLRLGGSCSPSELIATVGVDFRSEAFWKGGFAALEKLMTEFEAIWSRVK